MKHPCAYLIPALAAILLAVATGEPIDLLWKTVDGGGVMGSMSDDGAFELSGTIGQPDAGPGGPGMTGGAFTLTGGFWFETPLGDCNGNGFGDLADHADFAACMGGPAVIVTDGCVCFDTNEDGTADLLDFAAAQKNFAE